MLTLHHGEDIALRTAAWRRENPGAPEPGVYVVTSIYGALPRREYVTRDSLLVALPNLKAFLEQQAEADDDWRELAEAMGIAYGMVEAVQPALSAVQ